ncbi:MAG: hypothetical protein IIC61_12010 [Proteobacteria bacterium]|nr:hypothetical protein [Pseudomonadota bacterium]
MNLTSRVSTTAVSALLVSLVGFGPSLAQDASSTASTAQPAPISFPREIKGDEGTVVFHTPQIDSWNNFDSLSGRAAIEVTPMGEDEPVYGVVEFTADTDPNLELRMVAVENMKITATSFPVTDDSRREDLERIFRNTVLSKTQYVPLDIILSYIAPDAALPENEGLLFDPPPIFYSNSPAVLLITDGEPLLAPIPDTKLQYVVNTNWDLIRYKDREWYLRHDSRWLKNKNLSGEWRYDSTLPRDFKKFPLDGNWVDAKKAIPPAKAGSKTAPVVFVSDRPAELIVTDGKPGFRTVGGPGLKYVNNTASDLFRFRDRFYYLVSGRWFSADLLRGPWQHVKELPKAFAAIPADHEKGHVLAAVPNTDEARLAALEAALPRKATINRDAGSNISVYYQGEPVFENIPGTDVERAINSSNDILRVENAYYLCYNAVWYVAMRADGPWIVTDTIPAVIYSIPASSPSHHVTYVTVYESDSSSVSTSYTSGYFGIYVGFGVAMYGSGWYYPPYYGYYPYGGYPYYPYYYPYPYSYGSSAWYNPKTGMYGRSGSVYGPYGGYGRASSYNPQTGAYARGSAVWDNNEIAGSAAAYNPRTGTGVATNRYVNEHGGWGESLVTHNDKWLQTQSQWDRDSRSTQFRTSAGGSGSIERQQSGNTVSRSGEFQKGEQTLNTRSVRNEQGVVVGAETGTGRSGAIGRSADGDLYAGKDGQVYKRGDDGWYQNNNGNWDKVDVPDARAAQIDQARSSVTDKRDSLSQNRTSDGSVRSQFPTRPNQGSFADSYGNRSNSSTRSFDSSRYSGTFNSSRRSELNRSLQARTSGYDRYNSRSSLNTGNRQSLGNRQIQRRRR